jgi:SAM-dependent methyltransferase
MIGPYPNRRSSVSETAQEIKSFGRVANDPWGARARDWAEIEDENSRPLFETVFAATGVGEGTRLLDVGCGSGLACAIAAGRGAQVTGLDASPGLLEIARERAPEGDFRLGDMTSLPFDDDSFDVVTFINTLFFAADHEAALREAAQVARSGAQLAVIAWEAPEKVELTAYLAAIEPLLPPSPVEINPFIPADELERLARRSGLEPQRNLELDWSWQYPELETMLRGLLSPGPSALAIEAVGEEGVREALMTALEPFRMTGGGYRLESIVRCLIATPR